MFCVETKSYYPSSMAFLLSEGIQSGYNKLLIRRFDKGDLSVKIPNKNRTVCLTSTSKKLSQNKGKKNGSY